jgi:hypothetical protein
VVVDSKKRGSSRRLRRATSRALRAGAGSLVLASAVLLAPPADAAKAPDTADPSLETRAREARARLALEAPAADSTGDPVQLTWWGNWHNWGYHPGWHNWPNWRNWHNWHNWGNY